MKTVVRAPGSFLIQKVSGSSPGRCVCVWGGGGGGGGRGGYNFFLHGQLSVLTLI